MEDKKVYGKGKKKVELQQILGKVPKGRMIKEGKEKNEVKKCKCKKKSRMKKAWEKMAYHSDGSFSMSRLMMFFSFIPSLLLIPIGIFCGIKGIILPENIYNYAFKMSVGGASQYTISKGLFAVQEVKKGNK